ncbi:MAG: hypothetical protein ACRD8W_16755 [Nitrososphaeraceae archaeon]
MYTIGYISIWKGVSVEFPNPVERQRWLADNGLAKDQEFYDRVLRQKTEGNIPQTGVTADESD